MKKTLCALAILTLLTTTTFKNNLFGQKYSYPDGWGPEGYSLAEDDPGGVTVNFTIRDFEMSEYDINGEILKKVLLSGHFMFNEEGAPDLPGSSRYILVPEGAAVEMQIISARTENLGGLDVLPAPKIPLDIDNQPMDYIRDTSIYNHNAFYPENPVIIQTGLKIRGMSVALLGIMPFQYNPVTKEMIVYRDIRVRLTFTGGNGKFGVDRYRSRFWDPILEDYLMNHSALPQVDYTTRYNPGSRSTGCEYLIICPDGAEFQQWADSIKVFRTEQGILTEVVTVTEAGGNTSTAIENYVNNAYNNWDIPPSAVLLLGDHGTDPLNSVTSVILNNHPSGYNPYVSDNIYADVDNDQLPDIAFARITARNATELERMVHKFMDYERNPPTNPDFYDHPITALGWQTERWFQICSETIGGFWKNELGKNPVRINAIYAGNPDVDPWSTATNTTTVLNYFGPSGQGYIPSSPTALGNWTGGTATQINNAINSGSFLLQHRDHGYYAGWGEPAYNTTSINGLTNTDLTFIMSINCQTGKFEYSTETFTEKFHRYQYGGNPSGALGLIAATEVSYSFVNDVYVWGLYDYMWPNFMPTYNSNPVSRGLLPCYGNVAGKYHLQQSSWPASSTSIKEITYRLFHHHGDAYLTLYSEVPQPLTVSHSTTLQAALNSFTVTADQGAFIALTIDGEIIGTAEGTGGALQIPIPGDQIPGQTMVVTVTKQNHYRYRDLVQVVPSSGVYIMFENVSVNDANGNGNGVLDFSETALLSLSLRNSGTSVGSNISATLSTQDPMVQVTDSLASFGNIASGDTAFVQDAYQVQLSDNLPDGHEIQFKVTATDGTDEWIDYFNLTGHASILQMVSFEIDDSGGNSNGRFDAGETVELKISLSNTGSVTAFNGEVSLTCSDPYLQVLLQNQACGHILTDDTSTSAFPISSTPQTPIGHPVTLYLTISADNGASVQDSLNILIGQYPALVLDLDPNTSSGPAILSALQSNGMVAVYSTAFPANLLQYQSVFCCLGVYSNNRVLSSSEGQMLADYLEAGGRLYMEGGDTWAYDPQTAVHPMFGITGVSDGSSDLVSVNGLSGTFASGMTFSYSGEKNWIDRLASNSPAYSTFQNSSPVYVTTIAKDGGNYRTIGASHEFGGLTNGAFTKVQLMAEYMVFLGLPVISTWQGTTNNWNTPGNWSNGIIPDNDINVVIPYNPGAPYPVQFTGGTAECKSLKVQQGVNFTIPAGVVFTIHQ